MAKKIPQRAEGWKFAGAAGRFTVWHAGKNDYRITDGADGEVIATRDQFGLAHSFARHLSDADRAAKVAAARAEFEAHPAHRAYLLKITQSLNEGVPAGRAYDAYIAEAAAANRAARVSIGAAHGVFLA